jgi:hypothetical protein
MQIDHAPFESGRRLFSFSAPPAERSPKRSGKYRPAFFAQNAAFSAEFAAISSGVGVVPCNSVQTAPANRDAVTVQLFPFELIDCRFVAR